MAAVTKVYISQEMVAFGETLNSITCASILYTNGAHAVRCSFPYNNVVISEQTFWIEHAHAVKTSVLVHRDAVYEMKFCKSIIIISERVHARKKHENKI